MKLTYLIGASGSGKTTAAELLEKENLPNLHIYYFDRIGVPSKEEMLVQYGGGEEWQRVKTIEVTKSIKEQYSAFRSVLLDTQTRPTFIEEAVRAANFSDYEVILFDCSDDIRKSRLQGRGQPELADEQMMNWAKYLRNECETRGYGIVDTSNITQQESVNILRETLER